MVPRSPRILLGLCCSCSISALASPYLLERKHTQRRTSMKDFLRSKLFLTLAALLLIAGAFAGPLSSSILHAYAQGPISPPAGLVSWWPGDGNYNDIVGSNNLTPQG